MPTSSIFRNIVLNTEEEVENFVNALEEAEKKACYIPSDLNKMMSDEDIIKYFGSEEQKEELKVGRKSELNVKVNYEARENAERILTELGLSIEDAVNILLKQIEIHSGIPFEVRLPYYFNNMDSDTDMDKEE